jgi:hypothetical protein
MTSNYRKWTLGEYVCDATSSAQGRHHRLVSPTLIWHKTRLDEVAPAIDNGFVQKRECCHVIRSAELATSVCAGRSRLVRNVTVLPTRTRAGEVVEIGVLPVEHRLRIVRQGH